MPVHRHVHGLMEDIVYPAHRGSGQRPTVYSTFFLKQTVHSLHVGGGDLADLFVTQMGFDIVIHIAPVSFQRTGTHRGCGAFLQPNVQPCAQAHAAVLIQFRAVVLIHVLMKFFQQCFLCSG